MLPALHVWSAEADLTFSLKDVDGSLERLRGALRLIFGSMHSLRGPITETWVTQMRAKTTHAGGNGISHGDAGRQVIQITNFYASHEGLSLHIGPQGGNMLSPAEVAAVITATKGAVDIFDKLAGPIKRVILGQPKFEQAEAKDQRWRFRVETEGQSVVVKQGEDTRQKITGADLSKALEPHDLALVQTYERKMQDYFDLWTSVYASKDMSQDPMVNAKTDAQLKKLVGNMKTELLGILTFLQRIGVHLDDHYMHIRSLVEQQPSQCWRRPNFDHPRRLNLDQGAEAVAMTAICG